MSTSLLFRFTWVRIFLANLDSKDRMRQDSLGSFASMQSRVADPCAIGCIISTGLLTYSSVAPSTYIPLARSSRMRSGALSQASAAADLAAVLYISINDTLIVNSASSSALSRALNKSAAMRIMPRRLSSTAVAARGSHHRVRFSAACLPIRKNGAVVSRKRFFDEGPCCRVVHVVLRGSRLEHAIKCESVSRTFRAAASPFETVAADLDALAVIMKGNAWLRCTRLLLELIERPESAHDSYVA